MKKTIYDFNNYREFIRNRTENGAESWGIKRKLAEHIGCAATYISQVLKEQSDLSLEQVF